MDKVRLEFELAYFKAAIQYFSDFVIWIHWWNKSSIPELFFFSPLGYLRIFVIYYDWASLAQDQELMTRDNRTVL